MVIFRIYADCIAKTFRALGRSPWTLLLPIVYVGVYFPIAGLLAPLGFIGGFLMALVYDALLASFLYVLSELVAGSPLRLREMKDSIKPYFWPIMNVLFVIWIASMLLGPVLRTGAGGFGLLLALYAVLFILLNAVPEAIYLKGVYGGLAAIQTSIEFIQQNWIEWFVPNLLFGAAIWFGSPMLTRLPYGVFLTAVITGAFVHAAMVFRGFLFKALDGSTARQRELRYRLGR